MCVFSCRPRLAPRHAPAPDRVGPRPTSSMKNPSSSGLESSRWGRPVGGGNPIVVEVRPLLRVRRFLTWEDFHRQKTCDRDSSSSCAYPFTRGSGSSVDCASGSLTQVVMMQTSDERHLDHLSTVR